MSRWFQFISSKPEVSSACSKMADKEVRGRREGQRERGGREGGGREREREGVRRELERWGKEGHC